MAFEVLYCFFILISISMFIFPTQSTSSNDIAKFPPHVSYIEKVNVSIYYETLCPGSAYIANDLLNALFKEHLHYIVNLRMVPWGNARVVGPHELFLCQHGPDECYLNTIHACALKAYTDQLEYLSFIWCTENGALDQKPAANTEAVWKYCCGLLGLDPKPIEACYDSGEGRKLELGYSDETNGLVPAKEYVPWVVVNQEHIEEANLVASICKAYKGIAKPVVCANIPPKKNPAPPVCYPHDINGALEAPLASEKISPTSEAPPRSGKISPATKAPPDSRKISPTTEALPGSGKISPATKATPGSRKTSPTTEAPPGSGKIGPATEAPPGSGKTSPVTKTPPDSRKISPATQAPPGSGKISPTTKAPPGSRKISPATEAQPGSEKISPATKAPPG
uniref:Gamma-interferon-inducible lysosomal thiol reductase n=1 Tax=Manihot esculenta TaxID=3983 RepID=A0A2C9V9T0_MANES